MNKKDKVALVPELRFPEFYSTGEWKKSKIGEIFNNRQERGFLSLSLMSLTDKDGIIPQIDSSKKDTSNSDKSKYLRICIGDVVYNTMRMWQGRCAYSDVEGIVSPAYTVCTPKNGNNGLFFSYYFKTFNMIKRFHANSQGLVNDTLNLKYDAFSQISIAYPLGKEQLKIASCLSSLDDLITAEDKKLEALKAHKKGLMQKLFPAQGKTVPEWRFPEFRGKEEWEEKSLGSITIKVGSGTTPLGGETNYKKSGRPFIRSQNVGWGYLILDDIAYIDESTHQESISTEVLSGDTLLNITGASIGRSAVADYRVNGGNVNQHVCIIRTIADELSPWFLNQYFLSVYGQMQIESFQAGGNRLGLNFAQIRSFSVPLPSKIEEQHRIADCLTSLDDLIAAQAKKIDALKEHKKGLMQGLFPSIEEVSE